ncbi:MAG: PrsW family glutamic-type intramembrane protease [Bacteroidota bacterium]
MMLLFISVLPVIFILIYIYYKDKYEKEPLGLLLKAFIGGVMSAGATLLLLIPLNGYDLQAGNVVAGAFIKAFGWAAIPEESLKFIFLYWIIWKNRNFNEYYDGIVYAVSVSLGFACFENILYVTQHGITVGITRAFLSVPAHALFGVVMGYFFSLARFHDTNTLNNLFKSLFYAIILHGIFDFLIFLFADSAGHSSLLSLLLVITFFAFVAMLWRSGFRKIKKHIQLSVFR